MLAMTSGEEIMKYFYNETALPVSGARTRILRANEAMQEPSAALSQYSVVVTRPAFHVDSLPRRIIDMDMKCTVFPLLEILPAPDPGVVVKAARNLEQYALVVFVSPSAVSAFIGFLEAWPLDVAIGVVGKGSARRLKHYGFSPNNTRMIVPPSGESADSESLLRQLDLASLKGKRVLIVRSDKGRNFLTNALLANGTVVDHLAAYRRTAPKLDQFRAEKLLHLVRSRNTWLMTSAEALSVLVEQVDIAAGLEGLAEIRKQALVASHPRIHAAALQAGFADVTLSGTTDDELLETALSLRGSNRR
jgi:uroporphyrinogen-III synthase